MDPARWERIQELFHEAAARPAHERRAHLERRAGGDPGLIDEVLSLLEADEGSDSVLDRTLGDVARRMLDAGESGALPPDFGPYRLLARIGEGGMGAVFLAERPDLHSRVAIKLLRDGWLSPARRRRFASEQRMLARLDHPSIARLFDAGTLPDGTPWIVMEYVEGEPLTRHCAAHARDVAGVLRVFREVCEAVLHAHQRALIHRDLKPSNILVTREGRVKLIDFGIARSVLPDETQGGLTRTGESPLTPAYAAPEQLRGETVGVPGDIYSLGVVLYELLTGRTPFDVADLSPAEIERVVTSQEPERPSLAARRAGAGAPAPRALRGTGRAAWADLDVLCLTALQKDPARRYRSVDALVRDLDHFLRGEPLEARADTLGYRLGKFARREWRTLTAVGAVVAIVVTTVAFYTVRLRAARNEALAEAERTRRIQAFMTGLFEGGDEAAGPADTLRVLTLVARGEVEARALAGEPSVQAELYQTLGGIYHRLGAFERADTLLRAALALRRRTGGGRDPGEVGNLAALGLLLTDRSEHDEAERRVREALALARDARRPDRAGEARTLHALGYVLENRGRYAEAIAMLRAAARLDTVLGLPPADLSATLTELANCLYYAGDLAASDSINRRVMAIDRAIHGERHPHVASALVNLGVIQQDLGHPAEAERHFRAALDIYRGWYGDRHFECGAMYTMLGRVLIPQGRLSEADSLLHLALGIREEVYGPEHTWVASTLNELAILAQRRGRLAEAERLFRRQVEIYRRVFHDRHYLISLAMGNLAGAVLEQGRAVEAERLMREAIARYGETLAPDHPNVAIARIKLGRTLLRQGRFAEAERETRAGYELMGRQPEPVRTWMQQARRDLLAASTGMGRAADAARYRAELERALSDSLREAAH